MSEDGNYTPAAWAPDNFKSAYKKYDAHAGRTLDVAKATNKSAWDLVPEFIQTLCSYPLVIWTDETGSMDDWTKIIFSKLPYLDHEVRTEYLGDDAEIAFGAIGDAHNGEKYALQIRPFGQAEKSEVHLKELVIENKGGGGGEETYELGALYSARNIHMPNAVKPIIIFIGDEKPYSQVTVSMAKDYARVDLTDTIKTNDIFAELKRKFSVYYILKPYGGTSGDNLNVTTRAMLARWVELVGADHIAILGDPNRVVDVIFGILGIETGKIDYFKKEIEGRQKPEQVETVYDSLATIHKLEAGGTKLLNAGKSTLHVPLKGDDSKPLI